MTNILFRFLDAFSLIGTLKVMKLIADISHRQDRYADRLQWTGFVTFCFMVHFLQLYQMMGILHGTVDFQNDTSFKILPYDSISFQ